MKKLLLAVTLLCFICCKHEHKISFEKIIFKTSGCFGWCPVYNLEINNKKQVRLFAKKVYIEKDDHPYIDTTKMGYFVGEVNDTSYNKLVEQLQTIGLDSLKFPEITCCDGVITTIVVFYDGKRRTFKSMVPPEKANKLIITLSEICQSKLKRSSEKFDIEFSK